MQIVIAIIIGCIIAACIMGAWIGQCKSVHRKNGASDYKKKDSFKLLVKRDLFLYKKLEKMPRPQKK